MRKAKFLIFIVLIITIGAYIGLKNSTFFNSSASTISEKTKLNAVFKDSTKKETKIKISAIGDCAFGRDYRLAYKGFIDDVFRKNNYDYSYFFSNVAGILKNDDLTIANLETTLTTETKTAQKYDVSWNNWWFKGDPAFANILKPASIEAVSLANNHTFDYLQKGYDDTRKNVRKVGVGAFGYDDLYETEMKGIKIGLAGFNELGTVEQGTDINKLKAEIETKIKLLKSRNDLVIVSFHWGKEYSYQFNEKQKDLAHFTIDSGADLILGHHPHVIQGIEKYKDKYIVYSLGNFCFGGNKNPRDYDTFIYQQEIVFNKDKSIVRIEAPNYIPCSISSVKHINDYKPTPARGKDAVRILNKINAYSPYKTRVEVIKKTANSELVNLEDFIPNILIDLKYASNDNVTGQKLYNSNNAFLRKETAAKLKKASEILKKQGYRIKVWDAYRPSSVQQILWNKAVNKKVFANPKLGSNHTRGCAIDLTLTDLDGNDLEMPSKFDDPTGKANRTYKFATPNQKRNAQLLERAMVQSGFKPLATEWWHFDDTDYKLYDFIENQ